jgi:hypothetical protein
MTAAISVQVLANQPYQHQRRYYRRGASSE